MNRVGTALASLLLCTTLGAEKPAVTLRGQVLFDNEPLPGVTIRLYERNRVVAEVTSGSDGMYTIVDPPRGYYDLEASLEGLEGTTQEVYLDERDVVAEAMTLNLPVIDDPIVMSCGSPCDGDGLPTCDDYNRNRELESAAAENPRALDELRERYLRTTSREERARIGGYLVSVLEDDEEYIRPLMASADTVISFAERTEESLSEEQPDYVSWCNVTGHDPQNELWLLYHEAGALLGSTDSRAIPYVHRALHVHDFGLRMYALNFASLTCEPSLLRAINDDFDSLARDLGDYSVVSLFPCEDRALNERISAMDDLNLEQVLAEVSEQRNGELARLRLPSR